ncbi:MAG: hypothetical protein VX583_03160 [Bdellovibrionota bacterium]
MYRYLKLCSTNAVLFMNLFIVSGCITASKSDLAESWLKLSQTDKYQKEKALYKERIGDREFCWGVGVDEFLGNSAPQPSDRCIYPTSTFIVEYEHGFIFKTMTLKQNYRQLKVLQVTPAGYLVTGTHFGKSKVVFIHKRKGDNLVDGSFLDPSQNWNVYKYSGPVSYKSVLGEKTVHSFKRFTVEELGSARKDLKFYSPTRDFFIESKLWTYVKDPLPKE